jgi:hypothetical protein
MRCRLILSLIAASGVFVSCGGDDNGTKPDTTPPTVISTNPATDEENVRTTTTISATFSEAIEASTINDTTFAIVGNIPGTITYSVRTATFTPDTDLVVSHIYTAAITTGVRDLAGNAIEANHVWQFTTADVMLVDGADYFPMADGDRWYYSDSLMQPVVREVSGDTIITSRQCKRIIHNGETAEAWSIDTAGFNVHLLTDVFHFRFEPPLVIPFDLAQEEPYDYSSTAFWVDSADTAWEAPISGTLKFKGYITYDTPTGIHFDDVIRFFYIPDGYSEFYARDVGLLDNEDLVLDSAFVGGVWYH